MFDRITFDPEIMAGRASIRGMRIPVSVIVSHFADGATYDECCTSSRHWNAKTSIRPLPMLRPLPVTK